MRRVRINRIDLRLRNISPAMAQDAARLLGPALSRVLASGREEGRLRAAPANPPAAGAAVRRPNDGRPDHQDAGRLAIGASPSADGLATNIAARIAAQVRKG